MSGAGRSRRRSCPTSAVAECRHLCLRLVPVAVVAERQPRDPAGAHQTGTSRVRGREQVGFTLIVPAGSKPAGGWPVAVFGPGITRSKYDLFLAADENASRGIATASIDPAGHAYGPRSDAAVDSLDHRPRALLGLRPWHGCGQRRRDHRPGGRAGGRLARSLAPASGCATACVRRRWTTWPSCERSAAAWTWTATAVHGSAAGSRELLRAEPRGHLRDDADGNRPARARRTAQRPGRPDPRYRSPGARLPRTWWPPSSRTARRPCSTVAAKGSPRARRGTWSRRSRAPRAAPCRSRTWAPPATGSTAQVAPTPSPRCCVCGPRPAFPPSGWPTRSPSATRRCPIPPAPRCCAPESCST